MSRRILTTIAACAIAAATLCLSCGPIPGKTRKLLVWSPTRTLGELLDFYRLQFPEEASKFDVEFVCPGSDGYQESLEAILPDKPGAPAKAGAPDLFVVDATIVKRLAESGLSADLSRFKKRYADVYPFALDAASDEAGRVRGLAWEISPGAYFYRRSIAARYLGTDDPTKIQSMIQDNAKFARTAELLMETSNGRAAMIPSLGDLYQVYKAGRRDGWVRGGKLIIDPEMILLLDEAKAFYSSGFTAGQSQMGEGWFAALRGDLKDGSGKSVEVLGCFLPAWGLESILKANSLSANAVSDSSGDWAMAQGPVPYFWGGEWLMVNAAGRNKAQALDLVSRLCLNPALLELWARERSRPVSSMKAMDSVRKRWSDPFLGGQNSFSVFASIARAVNGKNLTSIGPEIDDLWQKQQSAFVVGDKDVQKAISDFKTEVKNRFPDVETE
jgi:multiple sugar transport system substrate-binding protein